MTKRTNIMKGLLKEAFLLGEQSIRDIHKGLSAIDFNSWYEKQHVVDVRFNLTHVRRRLYYLTEKGGYSRAQCIELDKCIDKMIEHGLIEVDEL